MNNNEIENLIEVIYPFIKKKIMHDTYFKNMVRSKNATVVSVNNENNINEKVEVGLPYDSASFYVTNKTDENLSVGDIVCIEYWIDLKNAVAVYKV